MTTVNRKLVVCFDAATRAFKPSAHNLSPEQALDHAKALEADRTRTSVLEQEGRHHTVDPRRCRSCINAAKKITDEHSARSSNQDQTGVATDPGEQSEED